MTTSELNDSAAERPLVTFALFAYKQQAYILDAIRGALSQTYRPLEIILSDDCSPDKTFEIIEAEYRRCRSSFDIRINKTPVNRGVTEHINDVIAMAKGRLIVMAAGDDISLPTRVEKIVARWGATGYQNCSIFSEFKEFYDGQPPGDVGGKIPASEEAKWLTIESRSPALMLQYPGCTQAITKDSFEIFGRLPSGIIQEDFLMKLRSILIGGITYIHEPLVLYRQTLNSESRNNRAGLRERTARHITYLKSILALLEQFEKDCFLAHERGFIAKDDLNWAIEQKRKYSHKTQDEINFFASSSLRRLALVFANGQVFPSRTRRLLYSLFPGLYGWRTKRNWRMKRAKNETRNQS